MHKKSYHIELDLVVLNRYIDRIEEIQYAMYEVADDRRVLKKPDAFLTCISDHLLDNITHLRDHINWLIEHKKINKVNLSKGDESAS